MYFKDTGEAVFKGIGITNTKAVGKIKILKSASSEKREYSYAHNIDNEIMRTEIAIDKVANAINESSRRTMSEIGKSEAEIFEIHSMLLNDDDFLDAIKSEIRTGKYAEEAVEISAKRFENILLSLDDEYLRGRSADIRDIKNQILQALSEKEATKQDSEPYILVSDDLTPSQTVRLEKSKILGFVTFGGTPSSHTAILARAMGIPAIVGTGYISDDYDGMLALLDGAKGEVIINPSRKRREQFENEMENEDKIALEHERYLRSLMNKPAVTRSGHKIMIYANIGDESEVSGAISNGAEGIGLLRSEFLYLSKNTYPTENELFEAYRDVAIKMQGRRVVIRTLDIGADKKIPYFNLENEENPALGYRAIRICLDRKEIFKTQLRAILRASSYGTISIMVPMIVSVDEVRKCKSIIEECKRELLSNGVEFDKKIEFGIMIETPAAAIMSDKLSSEVDFFSVGTNDLTQYTLAADRQNSMVGKICEENTEPVLRLIKACADAIHQNGGWIGICGEMAADLSLTQSFASIGVDELSVSVPYLLGVRGKVSECK